VKEAHRTRDIGPAFRADRWHAQRVASDGYGCGKTRQRSRAIKLRQTAAQLNVKPTSTSECQQEHDTDHNEEKPADLGEGRTHGRVEDRTTNRHECSPKNSFVERFRVRPSRRARRPTRCRARRGWRPPAAREFELRQAAERCSAVRAQRAGYPTSLEP
jgi:hypothetical protein